MIKAPDEFRSNIVNKINCFINNKKISVNIERGIFNYSIKRAREKNVVRKWENKYFVRIYSNRFRTINNNLNPKMTTCNKELFNDIINKKIKSKKLSYMNHQEMYSTLWKKLVDDKIKRSKNLISEDMSCATDEFKCYRCKKRKCTYYQLQTRSADEPMTTFVTCLNCGNRWKF